MPDLTDDTPPTSTAPISAMSAAPVSATPPAPRPPATSAAPSSAPVVSGGVTSASVTSGAKPAPAAVKPPPARPPEPPRAPPPPPPPEPPSRAPLILGVLGFLLLAGVAAWQWTEIQELHRQIAGQGDGAIDPGRIAALEDQLRTMRQDLQTLAAKPTPAPVDTAPLEARLSALEKRPDPAPVDLAPLTQRLTALEQRPTVAPFDDSALRAKLDQVSKDAASRLDTLTKDYTTKLDSLSEKLATAQAQATESADRAAKAGRLESAMLALSAGKPLGDVPGAGPALQRFATTPPPTDASLRLSFEAAAKAAEAASDPAAGTADLGARMWDRVQTLVTVRRGDTVLVGAPASVVLADARKQLVAGDIAAAVATLDRLDKPAAKAMAAWRGEAQALLDARASLASLASNQPATP